jgi:hypothetical protein
MHLPHLKPIDAFAPMAPQPARSVGRASDRSRIAPVFEQGGGRRNPNRSFPEQETAAGAESPRAPGEAVVTETVAETVLAQLMEHHLEVAAAEAPQLGAAALEARQRYAEAAWVA